MDIKSQLKSEKSIRLLYGLTAESIDEVSSVIGEFLDLMKTERSNALRIRLLIEDALLVWNDYFGEETEITLEMGIVWRKPFITIRLRGEAKDPMNVAGGETDPWAENLLADLGLTPTYRYSEGENLIQLNLNRLRMNPALSLLLSAAVGIIIGFFADVILPDSFSLALTEHVLEPIQEAFFRMLDTIAGPVIFFSVLAAVCGVGHASIRKKNLRLMLWRVLAICFLCTTFLCCLCFFVMKQEFISTSIDGSLADTLLSFFLRFVPEDILTPFINADSFQIILLAGLIGNAAIAADFGSSSSMNLEDTVGRANSIGLTVSEWVSRLSPTFVAILLILGIQNNTMGEILGIVRPFLLYLAFSGAFLILGLLYVSRKEDVSPRVLAAKMKESFLVALKEFSVDASFSVNQDCCIKQLGIDRSVVRSSLPVGLLSYMPASTFAVMIFIMYGASCYHVRISSIWCMMAVFLVVILQAASPPVAGVDLTEYAAIFMHLGVPTEALTIVLVADILVGLTAPPLNQAMLQIELVLEADRLGKLNKDVLRRPPA